MNLVRTEVPISERVNNSMPTDTQMLNWIATYVTEINSLPEATEGNVRLELIWAWEDEAEKHKQSGVEDFEAKDCGTALRKCVRAGMRHTG